LIPVNLLYHIAQALRDDQNDLEVHIPNMIGSRRKWFAEGIHAGISAEADNGGINSKKDLTTR
jgi:hypothetical protein